MKRTKLALLVATIITAQSTLAAKTVKDFNVSNIDEFRTALAYNGPRTIHFNVPEEAKSNPFGFVIYAKDHKDFLVENGDITIDGGTATVPVTLYGATLKIENAKNVKISNIHVRLGASDFTRRGLGKKDAKRIARGSIDIIKGENIEVSHSSFSWGTDEVVTIESSKNVTFKNDIISEPLNAPKDKYGEYIHYEEHPHGYCMLIKGSEKILIENTLFVDCLERGPSVSPDGKYNNSVLVANTLNYNYGEAGAKFNDGSSGKFMTYYTLIKNYYLPGADSYGSAIVIDYPAKKSEVRLASIENYSLSGKAKAVYAKSSNKGKIKEDDKYRLTYEDIELIDANKLEEALPAFVGARLPHLDLVDTRVLEQLKTRAGKMLDNENQTPEYAYLEEAISTK